MAEIVYADDYEAITGLKKPAVETKVVTAPKAAKVAEATVAEVK
jgi:hypothetical protein